MCARGGTLAAAGGGPCTASGEVLEGEFLFIGIGFTKGGQAAGINN